MVFDEVSGIKTAVLDVHGSTQPPSATLWTDVNMLHGGKLGALSRLVSDAQINMYPDLLLR